MRLIGNLVGVEHTNESRFLSIKVKILRFIKYHCITLIIP